MVRDCGKRRYRDRIAAQIALISTGVVRKPGNRSEGRAYFCGRCKMWHLTSQDPKAAQ